MSFQELDPRAKLVLVTGVAVLGPVLQHGAALATIFAAELMIGRFAARSSSHRIVGRFLLTWSATAALFIGLIWLIAGRGAATAFAFDLLRFGVFFSAGLLFSTTTPPERLYDTLTRWRLPRNVLVPLTVGFRCLPRLAVEADGVLTALRLRGLTVSRALRSPRVLGQAVVLPILARSIKLSDDVAAAASLRAFGASPRRTTAYGVPWRPSDSAWMALGLVGLLALALVDRTTGW